MKIERGTAFKVLDHGYLKVVDFLGTDESIIEAARMSTNRGFISWDTYERCVLCETPWVRHDDGTMSLVPGFSASPCCDNRPFASQKVPRGDFGLLDTLYKNKHSTPFEFCDLVVEVQAPIMVFREWHRHRTQSYAELSARYTQMPNLHYVPAVERIQKQSKSNKQGSGEAFSPEDAEAIRGVFSRGQQSTYETYDALLVDGVAKEIARINTPVARYSRMRAKANLRNWLGFLMLRRAPAAQFEIRQYADVLGNIVGALWPRTYSLFLEHDFDALTLSSTEKAALKALLRGDAHPGVLDLDAVRKRLGV